MGCCESSCCKSMPCPYPRLVGLWISDDATNRSNLLANHDREKRMTQYGCSQWKHEHYYKSCKGAVLEINPAGYVNYIEMDGRCARSVYSGPITDWDGPDGVWIGCAPCFCCQKGCFHFDVLLILLQRCVSMGESCRNQDPRKKHQWC